MNTRQFDAKVKDMAAKIEQYARQDFPAMAARKTLRFIDGNFRAQGWQGKSFQRWKPNRRRGTILIKRGIYRRSFRSQTTVGASRIYTDFPAAAAHNRGFKGKVTIKEHTRRRYQAVRVGTGRLNRNGTERMKTVHQHTGTITVKKHVRAMNIPKRQAMPETAYDSPVLLNSIKKDIENHLKNLIK